MAVIQCESGHYYDDEKYPACPHCGESIGEDSPTASFVEDEELVHEKLLEMADGGENTVGIYQQRINLDPVVGWIVCLEGPERGRDYRIHAGRNFVGRSYRMDISIVDDKSVSREKHCSIIYDPKSGDYIIVPGDGTNTYLNDSSLAEPETLKEGDTIGIGDSKFVFIAFCTEGRTWH